MCKILSVFVCFFLICIVFAAQSLESHDDDDDDDDNRGREQPASLKKTEKY